MTGTYLIADTVVRIRSVYDRVQRMCSAYEYTPVTDEEVECNIICTPEDIEQERRFKGDEAQRLGGVIKEYPAPYIETLAVYRKLVEAVREKGILLMHGSVVAVGDEAYLFTARSGTGKTTHTGMWLDQIEGAYVVNGDKPLLRITSEGVIACGTPWCGKEGYGRNVQVPLKAICVLERDVDNHIAPMDAWEAFPQLMKQVYIPDHQDGVKETLTLLEQLIGSVGLYKLGCNMENEAAWVAYEGMTSGAR